MEESYSSPVGSPEDFHSNLEGWLIGTVGNLKDLKRKTEDQLIDNSFMNYSLIGL